MIAILIGLWTGLRGWLGRIPIAALAAAAVAIAIGTAAFAVYRAGRSAAEAEGLRRLAAENAATAAFYREAFSRAQDAVAVERAQTEALIVANEQLKEQVHAVARGLASPGVDAAVRGLQPRPAPASGAHVSGPHNRARLQNGTENAVDGN